ncbi:zinc finger protein 85-like isoform X7 [Achroia grisella]|uniref:zinc finger protein 85-like isoform X7 n=1 Tax=Achroia grisella TaxID=688607 RepID=UPI0027D34C15|nr:zinc finger protein 85-like isoform X7 [Achroia grisella]
MDTTMNHGMCRCCASEGTFKNLSNAYQWMGQEEIYSDMLKECFDISLTTAEPGEEGGICEVCITQLRNAANFKKQVQHTEVQFKKCLQDKLFKSDLIKVEATNLDDGDDSDNDNNLSDNFSGNEFDMAIKKEKEDPKPKKRVATRASTSRAKKSKVDDGEPSTKRSRHQSLATRQVNEVQTRVMLVKDKETHKELKETKDDIATISSELRKHYINIKEILKHSNATPIRYRIGVGYSCCYCNDQYQDPAHLKEHTSKIHHDVSKACFMQRNRLFEYFVRLDITKLICKICGSSIDTLENLMMHLKSKHQVNIYTDIKNRILPFKFESETLQCCMCLNVFNKFKTLLEHMNMHYKNFLCRICDAGFVNKRQLSIHRISHKIGTFRCGYCDKVFDNLTKRRSHENRVHIYKNLLHKCGYCNLKFTVGKQKNEHIEAVHGVKTSYNCQACERTFNCTKRLYSHIKRDHLMERLFKCTECTKEFFSAGQLKNHMLRHNGKKEYQCDICLKSYGRKYTLTEHMRIHANDRRFKCECCGQTFVQKCSWKGHMRTIHGKIV